MSVIYEALKKIEDGKKPRFVYKPGGNTKGLISNKKRFFLLLSLLAAVSLFFVFEGSVLINKKLVRGPRDIQQQYQPSHDFRAGIVLDETLEPEPVAAPKRIKSKKLTSNEYALEGIVYDEKDPFAIINGRVLKRNDKIDTFIITAIGKESVELTSVDEETILNLELLF